MARLMSHRALEPSRLGDVVQRNDNLVEIKMSVLQDENAVEFDLTQPVSISIYP